MEILGTRCFTDHGPNGRRTKERKLLHSRARLPQKLNTQREAVASAKVLLGPEVFHLVASNSIAKGDVITVAELAGIMGAKHTSLLIPLCHNISLTCVRRPASTALPDRLHLTRVALHP